MNKYSKDVWKRWARLVVQYGYNDLRAAECAGMLPEDMEEYSGLHFDHLQLAEMERINKFSRAVTDLHYTYILSKAGKSGSNINYEDLLPYILEPKTTKQKILEGVKKQKQKLKLLAAAKQKKETP
jgi:hypothetical protein